MINSSATAPPCPGLPEVLLIAGSRPEAARLAPVAAAMKALGRVDAMTVAGGADPMRVHDVFDALGAPPGVTVLPGGSPANSVRVGAVLAVRFDDLMTERKPAAVLVAGGGVAALVAAQVAFFHKIPVVHLHAGADVDDLLCPFPEEGNRRVIGQLTSLFLHTAGKGALCNVAGPNSITVGDTLTAVIPDSPALAELAARARRGASRVGMLDASVPSVLSAAATLLGGTPDLELVLVGRSSTDVWQDPVLAALTGHPRVHLLDLDRIRDLLGVVAVSAFAASDRCSRYFEAMACGVPAMLVEPARTHSDDLRGDLEDEEDPDWFSPVAPNTDAVLHAMSGLLADSSRPGVPGVVRTPASAAPRRVEHAVAWMLGLERDPVPTGPISEDPANAC
jgi:UDP-N-acetylglucosamine 2-epimerase (non-hydrolysing)